MEILFDRSCEDQEKWQVFLEIKPETKIAISDQCFDTPELAFFDAIKSLNKMLLDLDRRYMKLKMGADNVAR